MIQFYCECGELLNLYDEDAGKKTMCPVCGRERDVPFAPAPVQPDPSFTSLRALSDNVRKERPALEGRYDRGPDGQPRSQPGGSSGKATASLILGLISLLCSFFTGIPAIIFGILGLKEISQSRGQLRGKAPAITGIVLGTLTTLALLALAPFLIVYASNRVREASTQIRSSNNLMQIGLAMHNYHDDYGCFPPAEVRSLGPGNPNPAKPRGLSWRVALLPALGEDTLYNQFRLDEPWDSPNNMPLVARMPRVYQMPDQPANVPVGYTFYQAVVGPGALFDPQLPNGCRIADITDGTSNTFLVVEAATAVPWTKPDDLTYVPNGPPPQFGTQFKGGFNAAFADGQVRWIAPGTPPANLNAYITRSGGELVPRP
jgi:hypothetical protein